MMQFSLSYITWTILNELVLPIKYELIKLMPPYLWGRVRILYNWSIRFTYFNFKTFFSTIL